MQKNCPKDISADDVKKFQYICQITIFKHFGGNQTEEASEMSGSAVKSCVDKKRN